MAPSPRRSSPMRTKENNESLKRDLKKSRKMIDEMASFQNNLGGALIPGQKIALYAICTLIFFAGLAMVIYAATHPDMGQVESIQNQLYYTGGGFMVFSIVVAIIGYYWFKDMENSRTLRQLNALEFETQFARNIFRPN
tara:strand:- start:207 stop:623 length:417 start_codon:yes stop_codon:yes gene_type:complete